MEAEREAGAEAVVEAAERKRVQRLRRLQRLLRLPAVEVVAGVGAEVAEAEGVVAVAQTVRLRVDPLRQPRRRQPAVLLVRPARRLLPHNCPTT